MHEGTSGTNAAVPESKPMTQISQNEIPLQPDLDPPSEQPNRPDPVPVRRPYDPNDPGDPDQPGIPKPEIREPENEPPKMMDRNGSA